MTIQESTRRESRSELLEQFVRTRASELQARLARGDSAARASLARMRHAVGSNLEEHPEVWSDIYEGFPGELSGFGDELSSFEKAAYISLTLFALHQQSQVDPMHGTGSRNGFGSAVRRLANPSDEDGYKQAVLRRFQALATADEFAEVVHHLRGIVLLCKSESIPLDYGRLARDLVALSFPDSATRTKLRWARELYTTPRKRTETVNSLPD